MEDVLYQKKNEKNRNSIENMKKSNTINLLSSLKSSNFLRKERKDNHFSNSESPVRIDSPEGIIDKKINASNIVFSRNYYNSNYYYSNYFNNQNDSPNKIHEKEKVDNNFNTSKISKLEYSKIMIDKSDELYNSINVKFIHFPLKITFL